MTPQSKRPTGLSQHPKKQILHLHGPQTKRPILGPPVCSPYSRFSSFVSTPPPTNFPHCVPPLGVANYDLGKNTQPREGRKKNRTRASKRGHNRNQTYPSIPASRSDWLVFPPRGKDNCTKVLPAWGGTTSRRTDEAGFEGLCPDTDALLVLADFGPIRGRSLPA